MRLIFQPGDWRRRVVEPGFQGVRGFWFWVAESAGGESLGVMLPPPGERQSVPQRPRVASAVSSWTWMFMFSVVVPSLRSTALR